MAELLARGGRLGPSSPTITGLLRARYPAPGSTTPESNKSLLRFRLLMIAAGYEDGNDADALRHDPV